MKGVVGNGNGLGMKPFTPTVILARDFHWDL